MKNTSLWLVIICLTLSPGLSQVVHAQECEKVGMCAAHYRSEGNQKFDKKDYKGAITDYNRSISYGKNVDAYMGLAKAKSKIGDKAGAYLALREIDKKLNGAYQNYNGTGLSFTTCMTAREFNIPLKKWK
jgi:hypothetical protein